MGWRIGAVVVGGLGGLLALAWLAGMFVPLWTFIAQEGVWRGWMHWHQVMQFWNPILWVQRFIMWLPVALAWAGAQAMWDRGARA